MSDQPKPANNADMAPRFRIWALPCAFRKDGAPSLGTFGKTVRNVVIIRVEDWTQLCRENPALAATRFEVGGLE